MLTNITPVTNLVESGPLTWDMAKQIIQSQSNLATIGIAVLVAVAVGLMGASWIWNLFLRRHELEKATESLKSEILTKGKEDFAKLTTETKDAIDNMKKDIEKSVSKRMDLFDAEKARLFALIDEKYEWWESAAVSWATAMAGYVRIGEGGMIRRTLRGLDRCLGHCTELPQKENKERIEKYLAWIPNLLSQEKKQIEDKLSKLPKEIPKEPGT